MVELGRWPGYCWVVFREGVPPQNFSKTEEEAVQYGKMLQKHHTHTKRYVKRISINERYSVNPEGAKEISSY